MKEPQSYGYAVTLEAAKELRQTIQSSLKDGRKAHYMKIPNAKGQYKYWVWIDPISSVDKDVKVNQE